MKRRKFSFGKYKGKTILHICKTDPDYIEWVLQNIAWFSLLPKEQTAYEQHGLDKDWDMELDNELRELYDIH